MGMRRQDHFLLLLDYVFICTQFHCKLIAHLFSVLVTIFAVSFRFDYPDLFYIIFRLCSTHCFLPLFHQYIEPSVSQSYKMAYVHAEKMH